MRRFFWMVLVSLCGFFIGGIGGGSRGSLLGLAWGAGIGYGFGTVFNQTEVTKKIFAYWAGTLALVGPFFGLLVSAAVLPYGSSRQDAVAAFIGAGAGALLGLLAGALQVNRFRRRSQTVNPGSVA